MFNSPYMAASLAWFDALLAQRIEQIRQRHAPLLAQFLKLDERIAAELLGWPVCDPQLHGAVQMLTEARPLDDLMLPTALIRRLRGMLPTDHRPLTTDHRPPPERGRGGERRTGNLQSPISNHPILNSQFSILNSPATVVALIGGYGFGRRVIAAALCAEMGWPLLVVDIAQLVERDMAPEELAGRVLREARLRGAALLLASADTLLHEERLWSRRARRRWRRFARRAWARWRRESSPSSPIRMCRRAASS